MRLTAAPLRPQGPTLRDLRRPGLTLRAQLREGLQLQLVAPPVLRGHVALVHRASVGSAHPRAVDVQLKGVLGAVFAEVDAHPLVQVGINHHRPVPVPRTRPVVARELRLPLDECVDVSPLRKQLPATTRLCLLRKLEPRRIQKPGTGGTHDLLVPARAKALDRKAPKRMAGGRGHEKVGHGLATSLHACELLADLRAEFLWLSDEQELVAAWLCRAHTIARCDIEICVHATKQRHVNQAGGVRAFDRHVIAIV
mmetsp:Transcript_27177/g.79579  ORF Transcript_27177/g.79579 Transcript_27177/m.79579 type:complete len:254 (-) Transcript_27177:14-775(-)